MNLRFYSVLLGAVGTFATSLSAAPKTVTIPWASNYSVQNSQASFTGCTNTGATISFSGGTTVLGGVRGTIKLTNNKIDTKSYSVVGTAALTLAVQNGSATFYKQGSYEYGVAGNPWILWSYTDATDNKALLGRCVQGATAGIDRNGSFMNSLDWTVGTSVCSPTQSAINSSSVNRPTGVNGTVWLQNSLTNPQQTGSADGALSAGLMNLQTFQNQNGNSQKNFAGGNPHVYLKLEKATSFDINGNGTAWQILSPSNASSDAQGNVYLGRCRDLLQ